MFLKDVGIFTLAQMLATFLSFFYAIISARFLGVEQFGLFQALVGIFTIASAFFSPLNLATQHCVGITDSEDKPRVTGECLKLAILLSCGISLILLGLSPWLMKSMQMHSVAPILSVVMLLLTAALITTFWGALQGLNHFKQSSISRVVHALMTVVLGAVFMLFGTGVSGALAGYWASLLILSIYFFRQNKLFKFSKGFGHVWGEIRSVTAIMIAFGVLLAIDNLPMIVARMRLAPEICGVYGALYNFRNTIWPFAFAISLPLYAHVQASQDSARLLKKACLIVAGIAAAFIILGIFYSEWFFRNLYGHNYVQASKYMVPYGIVIFFQMISMVGMFYQTAVKSIRPIHLMVPFGVIITALFFLGDSIGELVIAQLLGASSYLWVVGLEKIFNKLKKT